MSTIVVEISMQSEYSRILEQHRRECELNGNYTSARLARDQKNDLVTDHHNRMLDDLLLRHSRNLEKVNSDFDNVIEQKNEYWKVFKANELRNEIERRRAILQEHQSQEIHTLRDKIMQKEVIVKFSPRLLELRKRLVTLGALGRYREAESLKIQVQQLEQEEREAFLKSVLNFRHKKERLVKLEHQKTAEALEVKLQEKVLIFQRQHKDEVEFLEKKKNTELLILKQKQALERQKISFALGLRPLTTPGGGIIHDKTQCKDPLIVTAAKLAAQRKMNDMSETNHKKAVKALTPKIRPLA